MTIVDAPGEISGLRVVLWTRIDHRHQSTGGCRHTVGGAFMAKPAGLAICCSEDEACVDLYYCDESWRPVTDTWHQTLDHARDQAEFEFAGVSETWV